MQKFLLIYHSPKEAMERFSKMNTEDVQKVMGVWMKWKEKHEESILDFGNPVGSQSIVSLSDCQQKSDDVTGYGVIQAENLEAAKLLLTDHPSLIDNDGSTVSLYPIHEM